MIHVVMYSGGIGSWCAASRVIERYGADDVVLLFADTLIEDADLYRFLFESSDRLGARLEVLRDGRTPWEVFRDVRMIGNTRADPCSRILKREITRNWVEENSKPNDAVVYLGIDWSEAHRFERARTSWLPWRAEAPMCEEPLLFKDQMLALLRKEGISPPNLYDFGFPHNNCGGFCIKAGRAHFAHLWRTMPARYKHHEEQEEALRKHLGKDVAILRDRRGGRTRPMTLRKLRERLERGESDKQTQFDWGGCGCFTE